MSAVGALRLGAAVGMVRTIAPLEGGSVAAAARARSAAAASGAVVTAGSALSRVTMSSSRLAGRDAVRGGIGLGRRHRVIHVFALRLLGAAAPG